MAKQLTHARTESFHSCPMLDRVMEHTRMLWCSCRLKSYVISCMRASPRRWLATSSRFRQSLPAQPRPLGHVFTSYWGEATFKFRACARAFVCACL